MKNLTFFILMFTCTLAYATSAQTVTQANADSSAAPQQPPIYQVDIIAFKNLQELKTMAPNQWLSYQPVNIENTLALAQQSQIAPIEQTQIEQYTPLPTNQFILNADAARIQRSSFFGYITQQSWFQQALDSAQTQTVLITGGQNYSNDDSNPIWELMGTVKITNSLYQYLNLQVNFYLTEPGTDASQNPANANNETNYPGLQMLQMRENRRIKINQLNYIDSPGFGLLIKVVKISQSTN